MGDMFYYEANLNKTRLENNCIDQYQHELVLCKQENAEKHYICIIQIAPPLTVLVVQKRCQNDRFLCMPITRRTCATIPSLVEYHATP